MRVTRRQVKDVRAWQVGDECHPRWLMKAVMRGDVVFEPDNVIIDCVGVVWNNGMKVFHVGDYLVKLPEGPIIGIDKEQFKMLYQPQLPAITVEELWYYQNKNYYKPQWVQEAIDNKDIMFGYGTILVWSHSLGDYVVYFPETCGDAKIRYEYIYGESQW